MAVLSTGMLLLVFYQLPLSSFLLIFTYLNIKLVLNRFYMIQVNLLMFILDIYDR